MVLQQQDGISDVLVGDVVCGIHLDEDKVTGTVATVSCSGWVKGLNEAAHDQWESMRCPNKVCVRLYVLYLLSIRAVCVGMSLYVTEDRLVALGEYFLCMDAWCVCVCVRLYIACCCCITSWIAQTAFAA